jgi:hypothetical protein
MQTGKYTLVEQQDVGIDLKATEQKVQSKWYSILFVVSFPSSAKLLRAHYLHFVAEPFVFVPRGALHIPTTVGALQAGTLQFFLTDTRILADGALCRIRPPSTNTNTFIPPKRSQANTIPPLFVFTALAGTAIGIISARFFWKC